MSQLQTNPISLRFPLKGMVKSLARADQPEMTTVDALNVLGYDTAGRARGAQRSGVGKVWGVSAVGSASLPAITVVEVDAVDMAIAQWVFSGSATLIGAGVPQLELSDDGASWHGATTASQVDATTIQGDYTDSGIDMTGGFMWRLTSEPTNIFQSPQITIPESGTGTVDF